VPDAHRVLLRRSRLPGGRGASRALDQREASLSRGRAARRPRAQRCAAGARLCRIPRLAGCEEDRMSEEPQGFRVTRTGIVYLVAAATALVLAFLGERTREGVFVLGSVPFAFVLFVLVLMGVAFFHPHTLW